MLGNKTAWLWSLIAFLLGGACGYLYSSRFCTKTLGTRVEHSLALNQTLRKAFTEREFLIRSLLRALTFNTPDQSAITNQLAKNEKEISSTLGAYYHPSFARSLQVVLAENDTALIQSFSSPDLKTILTKNSTTELAPLFHEYNASWTSNLIEPLISSNTSHLLQEVEALKNNNWQKADYEFSERLKSALQMADMLDQTITQQFPEKF